MPPPSHRPVVTISYSELSNPSPPAAPSPSSSPSPSPSDRIGSAFGPHDSSLGIIAVTGVPGYPPLRRRLLPLARRLAELPPHELDKVTVEGSGFAVGWSHGRERVEGDRADTSKGSFYANPLTDDMLRSARERTRLRGGGEGGTPPAGAEYPEVTDDELERAASSNPAFFAPNVWPVDALPELEGAVKEMGTLVVGVGRMLARLCDSYVSSVCSGYTKGKLESVLTTSLCCKARLLHYFPANQGQPQRCDRNRDVNSSDDSDFSDWCGWHNDHGSLTGLVPAMYLDPSGREVPSPDPYSGLYVKSRGGDLVGVVLPPDSLAFQVGETAQIHAGGLLMATPHAVRGCRPDRGGGEGVTREAFAVFMEPEYHGDMRPPVGRTEEDARGGPDADVRLPRTVRALGSRWRAGMNFGEFSDATLSAFH